MKKLLLSVIVAVISGASLLLSTAHAATITVSNTNDSGAGSLRQALIDANSGDTITFGLGAGSHTITLTVELAINKDVIINGPPTSSLTVSGGGVTRVFNVTAGTVEVANFTVTGAESGALEAQGASTVVTVRNMLFTGNHVYGSGGAMRVTGGATLNVYNSTISGNTGTHGAGFYNGSGILNLRSVTVTNNYANGDPGNGGGACFYPGEGGAIDVGPAGGTVTIANTILAGNAACNNALANINGPYTDLGYNIVGGDPMLQPLAANGGPTLSHAPQPGSPAIDQGKALSLTIDQRGSARPVRYDDRIAAPAGGNFSDIGAVELDTPVCTPPPTGLVGWWPGDGNSHDIQNHNDGSPSGTVTFAPGLVGQAFNFDGTSFETVGTPAVLNIAGNQITLDAWVNPNDSTKIGVYFGKANSGQNDYALFLLGDLTGCIRTSDGAEHFLHTGFVPPAGQWTHIAMTYDGANEIVYANGVELARLSFGGNIRDEGVPFFIGGRNGDFPANTLYINAKVDEVEVFTTALSPADIQAIYNAGYQGKCRSCTPPPPDMVAWWPGDGHANDIQGGNHGTIVGAVTYATGKVGQAFDLGGVTNQGLVSFGNQPALQLTAAITVDAWISPDTTTGNYQTVASKWAQGDSSWGLFIANSTAYGFITKTNGVLIQAAGGVVPVGTGQFTHVAMTYSNADGLRLYVNGSQVASAPGDPGGIKSSSNNVQIGNDQDQVPDRWFDGRIDEVEIFNRALTATEIAAIADAGNAGKCKPPASIQFSSATYPTSEGASLTVTVKRTGDTSGTSSIHYTTSDGTASAPSDYTAQTGDFTFAIGETSKVITIPIINDTATEGAEIFSVILSNVSGAILGTPSTATVTIAASDPSVASANDSGTGSLRQAIADALAGDTINFDSTVFGPGGGPHTIVLTSELLVNKDLTMSGPGANLLTVSGNNTGRVFDITDVTCGHTVAISGLTIANGRANNGGGIYNENANLTVSNCVFTGNTATTLTGSGGAIHNHGGSLGPNCVGATLTVTSCTFTGNSTANGYGGAIYNNGRQGNATVTITNSTLSGNSAANALGGGISNDGRQGSATATITNSTLSGNSGYDGGGIANDGSSAGNASLTINNSTISGNFAPEFGGGIYNGGNNGIASVRITNTTLSGNFLNGNPAVARGGGIYIDGSAGTATLEIGNTILNAGGSGGSIFNTQGSVTSLGYNLGSDATGPNNGSTDRINTDPKLGALGNYGGPTFTHTLLQGSPAIDKGKDLSGTSTDQRGFTRPVRFNTSITLPSGGDGSDIGALELVPSPLSFSSATNSVGEGDGNATITVKRTGGTDAVAAKVTLTDVTTSPADYVLPPPGALDTSFDPGTGANNQVFTTAVQADGKIIIGGNFSNYNGTGRNRVARLNANGSLDTTFNPGAGADLRVRTAAVQADGKIIIGGDFSNYNGTGRNFIARLNADGSLDTTFNPGTGADNLVFTTAVQPDGKIIIGGGFTTYNGTGRNRVARLNADGSLDTTFNPGTGADYTVITTAVQADGKIIIGGSFRSYNGTDRDRVARLNADGSLDTTFNPDTSADDFLVTSAVQVDGRVIIGGNFTTYNGTGRNKVARLNADGSLDSTFNPGTGANNQVTTTAVQADGKIIIGGVFTTYNGTGRNGVARLNADGSLDTTFNPGTGVNNDVSAIAVQTDGKIIIGGFFTTYNGTARSSIMRVNGDLFVTWPAGDLADKTIKLPIVDDTAHENAETLTLTLVPLTGGATIGTPSTQTLTITDNDPVPVVTSTNDTGPGSLRQAIADALAGDTINFDSTVFGPGGGPHTIVLTSGELVVDKSLTINGSGALTISGNNSTRVFHVASGKTVIISGMTITKGLNSSGSGVRNDGTLTLSNVFITRNTGVASSDGAGIYNAGTLTITGSTISSNVGATGSFGGGIESGGISVTMTNCTVSDNTAGSQGGGIRNAGGTFTIINSTIAFNAVTDASPAAGGGIYSDTSTGGTITLTNTIVSNNKAPLGPDAFGPITTQGYNIIGNNTGATVTGTTGDQIGTAGSPIDPLLGALGNYGGTTLTHTLLQGSPALDKGKNLAVDNNNNPILTDQRGFTRPVRFNTSITEPTGGDGSDIGALELVPSPLSFSSSTNSVGEGDGNAIITVKRASGTDAVTAKVTITDVTTAPADYVFKPGTRDTTFNAGSLGADRYVRAVAVQPDGKIVIGGEFTSYNGDAAASDYVMRLNTDGTRDTTFNAGGAGANSIVAAVAVQPDGKIVIGGYFFSYNGDAAASNYVMRLNADGTRDTTFNAGGLGADGPVLAMAVQPDGKIVIGGIFFSYNGDAAASDDVMRLNADGTRDTTFNAGGAGADSFVYALTVQPDGKIVIGGDFTSYNGDAAASDYIMRLNADGTRDTTFNAGGAGTDSTVIAVAVQPDGKIVIGGGFLSYNGDAAASDYIMRLNADGTRDTTFNAGSAGADSAVHVVAVQPDGKTIIGGDFTSYNGDAAASDYIMRLNTDGTRDTTFNAGGAGADTTVIAVAVQPDGKIVIGGQFTSYNDDGAASDYVMRLNGDLFVTWAAGDLTDKIVQLPIVQDLIAEGNETLTLTLVPLTGGATTGTPAAQTLTIVDDDIAPAFTSSTPPGGTFNQAYTHTFTASGSANGSSAKTFSLTGGSFPPGLSLTAGVLSGTPTAVGTYSNITVTASNGVSPAATQTFSITIVKATTTITWSNPADITYGTPLDSTQLNATASVTGSFIYNPVAGTVLNGGNNQTLSVSFAPSDTANYDNALKNVSINVLRATPTITWSNPADITYGTALSSTQLNATASVAGSFTYTPSAGTVLNAGANQDLAVFFEASDATNYNNAAKNVSINVLKATPTITWSNPADITYGTALSGTQLNASASVAGAFSYTPPAATVLNAGANQNLSTAFTPTDTTNYNNAAKNVNINVLKATPVITWSNPADIIFGTALSGTQLNATTPVAGSFSYTPPSGTVLNVGNAQTLSTTFTPTDTANYNNAAKNVSITVNPRVAPKITSAKSATFRVNQPGTFTVTTTGTPNPALTVSGSLPGGVTFTDNHNGTATIAGTPSAKGRSSLTITASNGTPPDATQKFKLKVAK